MARLTKYTPRLAAAAAALIIAAGAVAQNDRRPGGPPPPPRGGGGGELRGPAVRDDRAPGTDEGFVKGGNRRMGAGERIPPRVFLDALNSLGDDKLPADVRATPAQMEKLTALSEGFRAQRDEYMKKNAEELRTLRKDAGIREGRGGAGGGPGGPGAGGPEGGRRPEGGPRGGDRRPGGPGGDDAMNEGASVDPAKREAARARIREIEQGAPKIEDVYTKAWAELNDAQKKHVDAKLAEFRERGAKDREDNYVRQRVNQREGQRPGAGGPQGAGAGGPGGPGGPGAGDRRPGPGGPEARREGGMDDRALRDRRERIMRVFEQLPPEEQDRILSRLEERFADRLREGPGDQRPGAPGPDGARPRGRRGPGGPGGPGGGDNPPPAPPGR